MSEQYYEKYIKYKQKYFNLVYGGADIHKLSDKDVYTACDEIIKKIIQLNIYSHEELDLLLLTESKLKILELSTTYDKIIERITKQKIYSDEELSNLLKKSKIDIILKIGKEIEIEEIPTSRFSERKFTGLLILINHFYDLWEKIKFLFESENTFVLIQQTHSTKQTHSMEQTELKSQYFHKFATYLEEKSKQLFSYLKERIIKSDFDKPTISDSPELKIFLRSKSLFSLILQFLIKFYYPNIPYFSTMKPTNLLMAPYNLLMKHTDLLIPPYTFFKRVQGQQVNGLEISKYRTLPQSNNLIRLI